MKSSKPVLTRKVLTFLLLTLPMISQAEPLSISAKDMQAEDGDTILVTDESKTYKIQLSGIDAPEDTENPKLNVDLARTKLQKDRLLAMGKLATDHLRLLIKDHSPFVLNFDPQKTDRYGRIPGEIVNLGGKTLSDMMIKDGFSIVTTRSTSDELLQRLQPLQIEALAEGKGLWGHDPIASRAWAGIKTTP